MSESENTVRYLTDAARRRDSRDQSSGPVEPEPTRPGGRRARAGFDGAQGFANRMLGDQDEHDGGPPGLETSPTLDEQIDGALRRSQGSRRVTKLPMIPSAQTAGIIPEASGTLADSSSGAFRRTRPRVKVARKRRISGWGWMMVAVAVAAAVLAGLVIAKPGHSGSSDQPISSRSGTVAAVSYERHGSLAMTSGFLKQEARAEARAAARRELAIKRRLGHLEVGIAAASARDLMQLPHRDRARHYVSPAATSQPEAPSASASVPATSSPAQVTTAPTSPTYTPPAPSSGGGSSSSGGGSSSSGNDNSGGSSSTKSGSTPAFGSGGALGPGSSPDS
jgi:uncharacterized membrane protein YgcG